MQVKEYVQELVDDNRLRVEKIGSGNWYWSFAGDERRAKERVRSELLGEVERARAARERIEGRVGVRRERQEEEKGQGQGQGEGEDVERLRKELLDRKTALEQECKKARREMSARQTMQDRGKSVAAMKAETERFRAEAQMWTDNVLVLEGFVRRLAGGDREILAALQQECYGGEYVEGEGLRELESPGLGL